MTYPRVGARPRSRAMPQRSLSPTDATARLSTVSDEKLVSKEDEAVTDRLRADEVHGLLVAGLAKEALASPEHDREDDHPQLVDQVVLHQRAPELLTGWNDDVYFLLEL